MGKPSTRADVAAVMVMAAESASARNLTFEMACDAKGDIPVEVGLQLTRA